MTREEAIQMLKALNMMLRRPDGTPISDACDALDMAIEALSEPRGDLISRADAIQTFIRWGQKEFGYSDIIDDINALPSALADIGDYADRLWKIAYERGKAEAEAEHDHEPGQWQTEDGRKTKATITAEK